MTIAKAVNGSWEISIGRIKAVSIANLLDVETHNIHNIANSVSHFLRFRGGGELRFSYNQSGQILEFNWYKLDLAISPNGELKFGAQKTG
ncbi:MAG: hypothetical protein IPM03_07660 [Sulfuritalea sp.]|nr:hypothetical protein [Sulfuritalea sp.]